MHEMQPSSPDVTIADLTARVATLHVENARLREHHASERSTWDDERAALQSDNDLLRRQLADALRRAFGRSSERMDPAQLRIAFGSLVDEAVRAVLDPPPADTEATATKERKKREEAPRGAAAHESVERVRETREPDADERTCLGCSEPLRRIGEDVTSSLEWIPGRFVVREIARGKWACRCGEGSVVTAPLPKRPIEKSIASASFLSHLVVGKYQDHLPVARQVAIFERSGVTLSESTLSDWLHATAQMLRPIRDVVREQILAGDIVRIDDTRLEMQRNSKSLPKKRCFLWEYRDDSGATVFDFTLTRSGDEPQRFLTGFKGFVQSDGYAAHNQLFAKDRCRRRVGCWAHVRRGFVKALESAPVEASLAVALIGRLYDVERDARERQLGPAERARLRRERCPRVLDMLRNFLDEWAVTALPRSALGEAVGYALSQWPTLKVYLDDGRLEVDNNDVESAIRGIALGRKNHLFVGSERGGHDAAIFYSVIESCRAADVEPSAYLNDVIDRITADRTTDPRSLTPQAWKRARDPQPPGGDAQDLAPLF